MSAAPEPSSEERGPAAAPVFVERPTEWLVPDAWRIGAIFLAAAGVCALFGLEWLAWACGGLALFTGYFFRNPERAIPGDERTVVSPADGRVLEVVEVEDDEGRPFVRVGIFLSVFNVHVNRAPVAGRVTRIEKSGDAYLAAFDPNAERRNVRCDLWLDTAFGVVRVSQITGLIARRIVCHPQPGEWLGRGIRYGLIRFGSRTDVWLPREAAVQVSKGQTMRGGSTVVALLPSEAAPRERGGAGA